MFITPTAHGWNLLRARDGESGEGGGEGHHAIGSTSGHDVHPSRPRLVCSRSERHQLGALAFAHEGAPRSAAVFLQRQPRRHVLLAAKESQHGEDPPVLVGRVQ